MMNKSILQVVHESMNDFHKHGLLNELTMHEFDSLCLPKIKAYNPDEIKKIRLKNQASQGVFAAFLNTSKSTIQKWEQGTKKPTGSSLKLLNMVDQKGLEILI